MSKVLVKAVYGGPVVYPESTRTFLKSASLPDNRPPQMHECSSPLNLRDRSI